MVLENDLKKGKVHMCCDCGIFTEEERNICICGCQCFETIELEEVK